MYYKSLFFSIMTAALCTGENRAALVKGEALFYDISVFGIKVGRQETVILDSSEIKGRRAWHIHSRTYSLGIISHIYILDDVFETWLDMENYRPLLAKRRIQEGSWRDEVRLEFDWENMEYMIFDKRNLHGKKARLRENAVELLSVIYAIRSVEFSKTAEFNFSFVNQNPGENYDIAFLASPGRNFSFVYQRPGGADKKKMSTVLCVQKNRNEKLGLEIYCAPELYNIPLRVEIALFKIGGWGTINVKGTLDKYLRP
ncbi:MAG: hypothetical protein A2096_11315 [Spirochaetes bacterium GWF1_41_5]|nr:MAG: hypothetical protein A2096_11315 [Spirochaetes bacterium GWF1_41_5]HBE03946.1 hypothetical protein [Spirochaetia bacterium]